MRLLTLVLTTLVLATVAVAQEGPAPGYATALDYAADHAEEQVADASADPVGYGQGKANVHQLGQEAGHAAWLACWAAYDAGASPPGGACDPFFQAPSSVEPPVDENETAAERVNATLAEANATAQEAVDTLQETQEELPGGLELGGAWDAVREAIASAFEAVADAVVRLGAPLDLWRDASLAMLEGSVERSLRGMEVSAAGYASLGEEVLDGVQASWDGVRVAGVATQDAAAATGEAIGDAATATGRGVQKGAAALGDGIQEAARATGRAVQDAAGAMGDAVADGWSTVADAVAGLFGSSSDRSGQAERPADDLLDGRVDEAGLLDEVTETVPLL